MSRSGLRARWKYSRAASGEVKFLRDAVDPPAPVDLLRADVEAELLLDRAGDEATHRVRLPAEDLLEFRVADALGATQHVDDLGLLAVGAGVARLCGPVRPRVGARGGLRGRLLSAQAGVEGVGSSPGPPLAGCGASSASTPMAEERVQAVIRVRICYAPGGL